MLKNDYEYISRKMYRGKYVSYTLRHNNKPIIMDTKRVKELLASGFKINGLLLTSDNRIVLRTKGKTTVPAFESYVGDSLRVFTRTAISMVKNNRAFVSELISNIQRFPNYILSVSGLRNTGKTVGMLCAIAALDLYDSAVFININVNSSKELDGRELFEYISTHFADKKYVFIDEATYISNFVNSALSYYNNLSVLGTCVIFSGTNSLALKLARDSVLYHRTLFTYTTFMPYSDAKSTMNMSFKDYVVNGGIYEPVTLHTIDETVTYLSTSIVDNIISSLNHNTPYINRYKALLNISDEKLLVIVLTVLLEISFHLIDKPRNGINIKFISSQLSNSQTTRDTLISIAHSILGIKSVTNPTFEEYSATIRALVDLQLIAPVSNCVNGSDIIYYIVNPAMFNQVVTKLISEFQRLNLLTQPINMGIKYGFLLESVVACHLINATRYRESTVYYYREDNKEIDIVIRDDTEALSETPFVYHLLEIKFTSSIDGTVRRTKWLNQVTELPDGVIANRYILYMGDSMTKFNAFSKDYTDISDSERLSVESLNKGTVLVPVINFISNMDKFIPFGKTARL